MASQISAGNRGGAPRTDRTPPPRGILGVPDRLPFRVTRTPPAEDLQWCIDRFWTSAWAVPAGRAVTARVLPHPTVNLTVESGRLVITGVAAGVFRRTLTGTGQVFGIKLRPGVARLFTPVPIGALSGTGQPADDLVPDGGRLAARIDAADTDTERIRIAESYVRELGLTPTAELLLVQQAVGILVGDPSVRRVSDAVARLPVTERTLQRLFAEYLGLTPGWVLRRGRLHAAAERLIQRTAGDRPGLADVAAEFGYADQAHLTNDFTKIIGMPPTSWLADLVSEHAAAARPEVVPAG